MSSAGTFFNVVKRLLLITEDLSRLSSDQKALDLRVQDHSERLVRLETLVEAARENSKHRRLPGK
jgi:hypothetical protein